MSTADGKAEPYFSLDALRVAHDDLLQSIPDDETELSEQARHDLDARIGDFIQRAVAMGTQLDSPADRRTAQGLIDYWVANAYATSRTRSRSLPLPERGNLTLRSFDRNRVAEAIQSADKYIAGLDANGQELVRRIVINLVHLSSTDKTFRAVSLERNKLLSLGDVQRADSIIGELVTVGVLKLNSTSNGDQVVLAYDALTRQWPRLGSWIDERISFREAALFWDRNGRLDGALLTEDLADTPSCCSDLNKLELEFIAASQEHNRSLELTHRTEKRHRLRLFYSLSGALAVVLGFALSPFVADVWVNYWTKNYNDTLLKASLETKAMDAAGKQRLTSEIRWLTSHGKPLTFMNRTIEGLDLSAIYRRGVSPAVPDFAKSILRKVTFKDANLQYASFSQTTIINSDFKNTDLTSTRFDEAAITGTSFSKATLYRALFDRARLVGVDFSETDLRSISFRNVKLLDELMPSFEGTAWWLAMGWNFEQIEKIAKKFPRERLKDAEVFKNEMSALEAKVKAASTPTEQAIARNELAWTHAIYGIDLDVAEAMAVESEKSFQQLRESVDPKWFDDTYGNFNDTLAYIQMQKGELQMARETYNRSLQRVESDGEVLFRYAVMLYALSESSLTSEPEKNKLKEDAITRLQTSLVRYNYVPTHELYLLSRYLTGEFKAKIRELAGL